VRAETSESDRSTITSMASYRVALRRSDEGYSVSCPGCPVAVAGRNRGRGAANIALRFVNIYELQDRTRTSFSEAALIHVHNLAGFMRLSGSRARLRVRMTSTLRRVPLADISSCRSRRRARRAGAAMAWARWTRRDANASASSPGRAEQALHMEVPSPTWPTITPGKLSASRSRGWRRCIRRGARWARRHR